MNGMEKFRADESIRLAYYKHRGEISKVADETGYDIVYVEKICKKIEKKRRRDVDYHVAAAISSEIMEGHESRVAHIRILIDRLMEQASLQNSTCCNAKVRIQSWDGEKTFFCTNCNKECRVSGNKLDLAEYRKLLTLWGKEDECLAVFADRMGLTFKEDAPKITQNNFLIATSERPMLEERRKVVASRELNSADKDVINDAAELTPTQREKLRKELEMRAIEAAEEVIDEQER